MTKDEVRAQLPAVGDVRMERPGYIDSNTKDPLFIKPRRCVVIEVSREHLWYRVQYENGTTEAFKVPHLRPRRRCSANGKK